MVSSAISLVRFQHQQKVVSERATENVPFSFLKSNTLTSLKTMKTQPFSHLKLQTFLLCSTLAHQHTCIQISSFIFPKDVLSPQHVHPLFNTSHIGHYLSKLHMILFCFQATVATDVNQHPTHISIK